MSEVAHYNQIMSAHLQKHNQGVIMAKGIAFQVSTLYVFIFEAPCIAQHMYIRKSLMAMKSCFCICFYGKSLHVLHKYLPVPPFLNNIQTLCCCCCFSNYLLESKKKKSSFTVIFRESFSKLLGNTAGGKSMFPMIGVMWENGNIAYYRQKLQTDHIFISLTHDSVSSTLFKHLCWSFLYFLQV